MNKLIINKIKINKFSLHIKIIKFTKFILNTFLYFKNTSNSPNLFISVHVQFLFPKTHINYHNYSEFLLFLNFSTL